MFGSKVIKNVGGAACAAAAVLGAGGWAWADPAGKWDSLKEAAGKVIGVRECTLVELAVGDDASRPMQVRLPIGGEEWTLDLVPHSVRGPNYHALEQRADGKIYEVAPGRENTFRGTVAGQPGSMVAGGLMPDGMYAEAIGGDGTAYWVQPVGSLIEGAPADLYAVYTQGDVRAGPWRCGNTEVAAGHAGAGGPGNPFHDRGATLRVAQLSTDADFEYFSAYGGTGIVNSRIALIVNIMNVQYERETDITHVLFNQLVRTAEPDPFGSTDSNALLTSFQSDWNSNHSALRGDLNQLYTGKDLDTNTIGLAFIGQVCGSAAYGLVQSDFNGNLMSATDLSAHESGHIWSATHCDCSGNGTTVSTMNPFITSINRFTFSNNVDNVAQIVAHRNSRPCLTSTTGGADPRNDLCADAVPLGANTLIGWNNTGAASDGPAACGTITNDTWYSYVSPCDGTITVTTCGSNFDTFLVAYSGGCSALTQLACDDDNAACTGSTLSSIISWSATRGTFYLIRAGGFNGHTGDGLISLSQFCPAPANDRCGSATTVGQDSFPFTNNAAGTDGPLETGLCNNAGDAQVSKDVWFRYVAQCSGTVRLSTCGADFDTKIAVYAGGCPIGANSAVACNDDAGPACGGTRSSLDFAATVGTGYLFRVGGFAGSTGSGTLTVSALSCPPPLNDSCASAINASGGGTFNSTVLGAGNDGSNGCGSPTADIWYGFTAPASGGVLTATTCGTHDTGGTDLGIDTVLSIHTGCPGTAANQIACNDDWPGSVIPTACGGQDAGSQFDSAVQAALAPGQTVVIRLGRYSDSGPGGPVRLNVSFAVSGACCCGASCNFTSSAACGSQGGAFRGNGVACNAAGNNLTPCCRADFNHSGGVTVQDIFDFLSAYFTSGPCADANQSGSVSVQDIFDYLSAYFVGC